MSGREFEQQPPEFAIKPPKQARQELSQEIPYPDNLVPPFGPDEQAKVERISEQVGADIVDAMKANDIFPSDLIDSYEDEE
jgi:hypothetical protein